MRRLPVFALLVFALFPVSNVFADDCQAVADAYDALSRIPAYHQTIMMNGKQLLEMITVGDTLYSKQDQNWQKIPLGPGMRVQMQKKVIPNAASLKDCAKIGPEAVSGEAAVMYDYTPPPMEGAGALDPQRVWISDATGLPLRMTSKQQNTDVSLTFDHVVAPVQ